MKKTHFQAPWSKKEFLQICTSIIIAFLGVKYVLGSTENIGPIDGLSLLFAILLQSLILLAPIFLLSYKKHKLQAKSFGLKHCPTSTSMLYAFGGYITHILISICVTLVILFSDIQIPGYQFKETVLDLDLSTNLSIFLSFITVCIIGPVVEEIFFRGFLLRTLSNHYGGIIASGLSALVFTALHYPWHSFIPIFILGLILNQLVIITKSIKSSILLHILNNSVAFYITKLLHDGVISLDKLV